MINRDQTPLNMKIASAIAGIFLCQLATTASAAETNGPAIIPLPQKMTLQAGAFKLTPDTRIFVDSASRETGNFLTERLRKSTGYPYESDPKFWFLDDFSGIGVESLGRLEG